jgi:glycosyltransferase involved in cell wall biosynthesis
MKTCIIIPAYNEEKRIGKTLQEYCEFFRNQNQEFEILVVLNACKDNTLEIVKTKQKQFKEIKYLNFKRGGKGFAVTEGFKDAIKRKNDLIGFVDADSSTSPKAFYDLVGKKNDFDGVIASRYIKGAVVSPKQTIKRRIISRLGNFIIRSLFFINSRDTQCGAKLFKKKVIENIVKEIKLSEWVFDVDILYLCKRKGYKIKDIPTVWEDMAGSKLNIKEAGIKSLLGVIQLRIIYSPFRKILKPFKKIIGDLWRKIK